MKNRFKLFIDFWKGVGNLTLAQVFNCQCRWCNQCRKDRKDARKK